MNKKIILIALLAVVVIGVIGISALLVREKLTLLTGEELVQDKTANWKLYRSEKYGFEFKYPKEFDEYEVCKLKETDNGIELGESRFRIEVIEKPKELSLADYVNNFVNEQKKELGILDLPKEEAAKANIWVEAEKIFAGDNEGFKVDLPGRPTSIIFLTKGDKIYSITWGAWGVSGCIGYAQYELKNEYKEGTVPDEFEVFEQIPSTFRFY